MAYLCVLEDSQLHVYNGYGRERVSEAAAPQVLVALQPHAPDLWAVYRGDILGLLQG